MKFYKSYKLYKIWNGVTGTPRPYAKLTSLSSSSNLSLLLYRQVWKGLKRDQSCHRTVREKANESVTQMSNTDFVIYVMKCWVAVLQEVEEIIY